MPRGWRATSPRRGVDTGDRGRRRRYGERDGGRAAAGAGERQDAELGLLPCGTGIDFRRGLGLGDDPEVAVRRIAAPSGRRIDAGRISYVDDHGALASRHFINIARLGMSGATDRAVNADKRKGRMSAKALFLWRTVVEFMRYRFQDVRITVDDGEPVEARIALVAVANGRYFGGGMMIAPDAELDDGLFDIVILRAAGKFGLILDSGCSMAVGTATTGDHHPARHARSWSNRSAILPPIGALVDIDGESPGRIPATFEILPGALTLRC